MPRYTSLVSDPKTKAPDGDKVATFVKRHGQILVYLGAFGGSIIDESVGVFDGGAEHCQRSASRMTRWNVL